LIYGKNKFQLILAKQSSLDAQTRANQLEEAFASSDKKGREFTYGNYPSKL